MNAQVSVTDLFSRKEIQELTEPSDAYGAWAVAAHGLLLEEHLPA